jgi:hypothetical protein
MVQALIMSRLGRAVAVSALTGVLWRIFTCADLPKTMLNNDHFFQVGRSAGVCRAFATTSGVGGEFMLPTPVCHEVKGGRCMGGAEQCYHTCTGNENDLVFETFKEQQQQYQALLDGSKVCCWGMGDGVALASPS